MEVILFAIIIVILALIAWRLWKPSVVPEKKDDQGLLILQNQMQAEQKQLQAQLGELTKTLDARLGDSTKTMLAQSDRSVQIVREITSEITKVQEGQKQMVTLNDQLKNLNDILKNTKTRGVLGEYYLETVLKDVLPPGAYQLQYPFKDGTKVDAVIFYEGRVIPIDSKFSLENYNRLALAVSDDEKKRFTESFRNDIKTRIDETSKYIKTEEDTANFAFMFIPSEALYYDLLVNKIGTAAERDLIQYAAEKRVYPVSPTTFYVYLQMALQGLRQMEINRSTEVIRKNVGELQKHLARYEEYLEKIGSHLATTMNAHTIATREFGKINKDVMRIAPADEPATLEKSQEDQEMS